MKKWLIRILVLGVLAGAGYWAQTQWPDRAASLMFWKTADSKAAHKSSQPTTATVATRDINFAISAAGDIGPADQVSVRPEINGRIATLPVDIGDKVRSGQVLFTLDDSDLQIERSQRKTEIDGAVLQLDKSKRNYERAIKLFAEKLISQEVFEDTRTEFDLAKNSLERAQQALAAVDDKLTRTKIMAPFDCTILTRPVSVGQAVSGSSGVNSGTEVLTIANLSDLIITAHINQADVVRLAQGQKVNVELEAVPGLKSVGTVDRVAPQATIRNGIKGFSTRILLKNPDEQVRPGMTANLSIPLLSADNVLAVPLAAVFTEQGAHFVYVQKGTSYVRQSVQIGVADYDFAEVQSGLSGGEIISLIKPEGEIQDAVQAFPGGKPPGKPGSKPDKAKPAGKATAGPAASKSGTTI